MEWAWGEFNKMKEDLESLKCPVHNKRTWAATEWMKNYDVDVIIYRYCCTEFAEQIKKQFIDRGIFTSVQIDANKPIKSKRINK
jgi:hypothetical protein